MQKFSLGKGYIENSMSVNAKNAYSRGLKPRSYFTASQLNSLGFHYPVSFFHWLCKESYLLAQEQHHINFLSTVQTTSLLQR